MTDDEYDAYFRQAYNGLCRRVRWAGSLGPDDAHEVVSQLFLELYARLPAIATVDDARRFIHGRLRNRVIDMWRHNRARWDHECLTDNYESLGAFQSDVRPESHPDEWVEFDVADKRTLDVVNSLSSEERQQLRLRVLGFEPRECAELLGIERNAERTRWCRLTKRLAKAMDAAAGEKEATE